MIFVAFTIDDRRCAVSAAEVVGIVPSAPLRALDGAPRWIAGLLPHVDQLVPVIDVGLLHGHRPSRRAYSTRILVARYPRGPEDVRPLGLLAEGLVDVIEVEPSQWRPPGVATPDTPWLGPLADVGGRWVQRVTVTGLLPDEVRQRLFP